MAANRSSVVMGLVGVMTSSLPSSLEKSRASEEEAVLGSSSPAREKKSRQTQDAVTSTSVLGPALKHTASLSFLTK